jgi:PAS domain S-box-containing protein
LKLSHKGLILVVFLLALELVFVGTLAFQLRQAEQEAMKENHSKEIVGRTNHIIQLVYDAGKAAADYDSFKGDPDAARELHEIEPQILGEMAALKMLVRDEPRSLAIVERIDKSTGKILRFFSHMMGLVESGQEIEAFALMQKARGQFGKLRVDLVNDLRSLMKEQEKVIADSPAAQARARQDVQKLLVVGLACNIMVAIVVALVFVKGITGRLDMLVNNANRLARGQELNPLMVGTDEIARLDHVFHEMALALAEAARKERAIIENARDVICSIDFEGRFSKVSPASHQVLGYPPEQLIGRRFIEIVLAEDVKATEQAVGSLISGTVDLPVENRVVRQDGSIAHVLWSAHWSESEKSLFCVAHDITERKKLERMKQEFVAMISHDLRTPLTSVKGFLSMLIRGVYGTLNEVGEKRSNAAERNVSRLIALINDLLDIEKLESGTLDISPQLVDLFDVVSRSLDAVRVYAEQHNVQLETIPSTFELYADGDRLVQVLVNLVSNAVKFSPPGEKVTIEAVEVGDSVEVRVRDRGRGVPSSHREIIFDRFAQVEAADATKKGGTGLGLAICKAIIEQHGGKIGVDSEEGKGSTFYFRIPKAESVPVAVPQAETAS